MGISKSPFGSLPDGAPVEIYTLENKNGFRIRAIPYGCRLVQIWSKDRSGSFADVLWGYDDLSGYLVPRDSQGTVVGRFANRIGNAELTIDGISYALTANAGKDQLHGGVGTGSGFQEKLWTVTGIRDGREPSLSFSLLSPDGEGGFPGNLRAEVSYTLTEDDSLRIDYRASTDKKTAVNLTSHGFFNLGGYDSGSVHSHLLWIDADFYTPADERGIPTGEILPVKGTPLDFTAEKPLGQDILQVGKGYDHNLALNGSGYRKAAQLTDPGTGRVMTVFTDQPAIQLYTANNMAPGKTGKGGAKMEPQCAVCLETQHFPDAMHHKNFPGTLLEPGREFRSSTVYRFSVQK